MIWIYWRIYYMLDVNCYLIANETTPYTPYDAETVTWTDSPPELLLVFYVPISYESQDNLTVV